MGLLLLATACSSDPTVLRTDLPIEDDDRSAVVAVLRPGQSPDLRAFDVIDGAIDATWIVDVADGTDLSLFASTYRRTLSELGFEPGPIVPATEGPTRSLPAGDHMYRQAFDGAALGSWDAIDAIDPAVAAVPLPYQCRTWKAALFDLPNGVAATFMVAVGDRLLLGNLDGALFIAEPDGTFTTIPTTGLFWDAYAETDGSIYLAGPAGRVARARLTDAPDLEVLDEETIGADDLLFIAGDPTAGGTVRSAASLTSYYVRDDNGWRTAFAIDEPRALSWIGDGRMRGIFGYEFYFMGLEAGTEAQDEVHVSGIAGGMTSIGWSEGYGAIGGTEYGQVYRRQSQNNWTSLEALEPALVQIRGFAGIERGFLYARPGAIIEVIDDVPCPFGMPIAPVGDVERTEIGVLVEDAVTVGGRAELTVVGDNAAVLAWTGRTTRRPVLAWFR